MTFQELYRKNLLNQQIVQEKIIRKILYDCRMDVKTFFNKRLQHSNSCHSEYTMYLESKINLLSNEIHIYCSNFEMKISTYRNGTVQSFEIKKYETYDINSLSQESIRKVFKSRKERLNKSIMLAESIMNNKDYIVEQLKKLQQIQY